MNYFELFNIPVTLTPDSTLLAKKYFELQKKFHPDYFTLEAEADQDMALEQSAEINKALKVLKNPDATLQYLLTLKGVITGNEKYTLPPDFLMEVMELNEALGTNTGAVEEFKNNIYAGVSNIIEQYDDTTVTQEELEKLKEYYYKKKYLQRILERMEG